MSKVLIFMDGGLVQDVFSTDKDVEVVVVDYDVEDIDQEEINTSEEIEGLELLKDEVWRRIPPSCYFCEEDIDLNIEREERA